MMDFLSKFFSTDSIQSRMVRGIIHGVLGAVGSHASGLPPWAQVVISILGWVAGMIPGGQNNTSMNAVSPKA